MCSIVALGSCHDGTFGTGKLTSDVTSEVKLTAADCYGILQSKADLLSPLLSSREHATWLEECSPRVEVYGIFPSPQVIKGREGLYPPGVQLEGLEGLG